LLAAPGAGPIVARRLWDRFGSLDAVLNAPDNELASSGLKRAGLRALRSGKGLQYGPTEEIHKAEDLCIRMVPYTSPDYPEALRVQEGSPPVLFIKGDLLPRDAVAMAIVGTRRASLYGRMHAERMAFELAQAGFTIVSGLARGIDSVAHEAALKGNGRTLAVLGNGLASVYPRENRALAERVQADGALISECLPGTAPTPANFPPRNRIIAGLSLGVLVIEAAKRSGALITARFAGEMGKEVFALPGDVGRPQTRGTHQLIRDGAKLVESLQDVLEELGPLARAVDMDDHASPLPDPRALVLNHHERAIYDLLDGTPKDIDQITRQSGLSPANTASTLMVLELKHLAVQTPGQRYVRAGAFVRNVTADD